MQGLIILSCVYLAITCALVIAGISIFKQMQQTIDKLTDKVMSKDLKEYKDLTEPAPVYKPVIRTDEEEWALEIEEMKV